MLAPQEVHDESRTDVMVEQDEPSETNLTLTVLVPAHNEEATLAQTLSSLWSQSRPPNRIVVVADNCTDATPDIALENGAEVFATVDNTFKKAGGLNQALSELLATMGEFDIVLVMDADTVLVPAFLEVAVGRLEADPSLDCVGGVFYGEGGSGIVGALQRNEYVRYSRDIARHKGRVLVLTGTASIFRAELMKEIAAQRGTAFPGTPGQVYDTLSLTEDNEITLASKTLGAKMVSPRECRTITEVMPSWGDLWRQRMRWQRGALENIKNYGITRTTLRYWGQQCGLGYGTIALNCFLLLMLLTILCTGSLHLVPLWTIIGTVFIVERVVTVWRGGWSARLLAAPLVIELAYDLFQQAVYVKSLLDLVAHREATWNHVDRSADAEDDGGAPETIDNNQRAEALV